MYSVRKDQDLVASQLSRFGASWRGAARCELVEAGLAPLDRSGTTLAAFQIVGPRSFCSCLVLVRSLEIMDGTILTRVVHVGAGRQQEAGDEDLEVGWTASSYISACAPCACSLESG